MSVISMNEFSMCMGWLSHGLAWITAAWFGVALLIGIPWIISDEIRLRGEAPKPADVSAYADKMEVEHGAEAMTAVGHATYDALLRKDFASRRFLKAVSAELARRSHESDGRHNTHHGWKNSSNR
jgi:hypothetical protein